MKHKPARASDKKSDAAVQVLKVVPRPGLSPRQIGYSTGLKNAWSKNSAEKFREKH
jgi:hypothetical protein